MPTTGEATVTRLHARGTDRGAPRLDFSILGPLQVVVDGHPVALGSPKERVLLLRLLLSARRVVAVDTLIEDLWGGCPSEQAAANLRVYVSRLRKRLRDVSGHELLLTRSPGYVLDVDPARIDAVCCETAADQVRYLLSSGAYETAAATAREALAAWRGPVLGEAVAYLFAQPEAARLDELQRTLTEDRIEADLARGLDAELVGELSVLVDRQPYRQRLWRELMLALYRSGRQAEALRAYERLRKTLAEDLGISPDPDLAALEQAILTQDPGLTRRDPTAVTNRPRPPSEATVWRGALVCRAGEGTRAASRQLFGLLQGVSAAHRAVEVVAAEHDVCALFPSGADTLRCAADLVRAARRTGASIRVGAHGVPAGGDPSSLSAAARQLSYVADTGEVRVSDELARLGPGSGVRVAASGRSGGAHRRVIVDHERPRPSADALPSGPFVGREPELGILLDTWEAACAGRMQVSVVSGEPGIGKTALTRQLAARCWNDGGVVLSGHCDETMVVPFQPFVTAAGQYLSQRDPQDVATWRMPGAIELANLLGKWHATAIPERASADEVARRFWLFDAFVSVFREVSEEAPLLLLLDDLQWADLPTLHLLRHLVEQARECALHIVVTYRADEAGPATPLAVTLGELAHVHGFDHIALTGLDVDALSALMIATTGSGPNADAADRLLLETRGNPFFAVELIRQAAEMGDPPGVDDRRGPPVAVPQRVADVIRRRMNRLPDATRALLEVASVLGESFSVDIVEALIDLGEDELATALDTALDAGLVQECDGLVGTYSFAHALIRRCLQDGLGPSRRTRLHRRAGLLLLDRHGFQPGPHLGDIARHLVGGIVSREDQALAFDALMAAGRGAAVNVAFEDAASYYRRALDLLRSVGSVDAGEEVDVLVKLAEAQARAGDVDASDVALLEATAVARRAGAGELMARAALADGAEICQFGWATRPRNRVELLREALDLLSPSQYTLRCRLLDRLAVELHQSGERDACLRTARQALDLAARLGNAELLVCAKEAELIGLVGPELDPRDQLQRADDIVATAHASSSARLVDGARHLRHAALLQIGDVAGFAAETAAAASDNQGVPMRAYRTMVHETMLHTTAGELRRAEVRATEAFIAGQRIDEPTATSILGPQLAVIGWARGRLDVLVEPTRMIAERFPQFPIHRAVLGFVCGQTGRLDEATAELDRFVASGLDGSGLADQWLIVMYLLSVTSGRVGDPRHAEVLWSRLAPFADRIAATANGALCLGSVATAVAIVARTVGRLEEAVALFARAEAENRRIGARPLLALTLAEHAACLQILGDPRAAAVASEAFILASDLDMVGLDRPATQLQPDGNEAG